MKRFTSENALHSGPARVPQVQQQERRASAQQDLAPASFSTSAAGLRLPRESPLMPAARRGVSGADRLRFRDAGATPGDSTLMRAGLCIVVAAAASPAARGQPGLALLYICKVFHLAKDPVVQHQTMSVASHA